MAKISLTFIALTLAMSVSAATKYCEKEVASAPGTGSLLFTASKTGTSETTFTITSTETTFDALNAEGALYNVAAQDLGGGVTSTVWNKGWTLENNTLKKVVEWTTYPSQPIQLYIVARDSKDIIGATFTDIDVSVSCDGSGDSGDSGESTIVESNYCDKVLTGINYTDEIHMTCTKESEGNYRIVIIGENLNGLGGSWAYINNTQTYNLGANLSSSTTTEIVCNIVSTTDPQFYTDLFVKKKNGSSQYEVQYARPSDIIWGVCNIEPTPEPIYNSISESVCFGATYDWNGQTYSTAGEYTQEFTAVNGADSIVTLTLTIYPQTPDVTEDVTIDFGETYTWNNQEYTETGTYTTTLQDANGCDYQATLNLTVNSNSPSTPSTCTYEGGPGDALMEQPGKDQFESGYEITLKIDEEDSDKIHITATVFDSDAPAETAYFQNYPNYDYAQNTAQHKFAGSRQNTFETTISISSLISNRADGIIRFAIKFEYPDGVIKVTTPEFFYLDGSGCAQRVFAIYHHDDLPATPLEGEDQFTEFAGGKILQSIQYKRRMPSEVWETLSVPFDVDSVTAFDPATGEHVRLYAQYNNGSTQAGHYWLRYFKTPEVTRTDFQPNWYDIEADNQDAAKPEKDKAYIIRLPNGGGYYSDKYIVFHGRGYQIIADTYNAPALPAEDYYSYSGNNTMMPQDLFSAYVLDNAGYYFTSSSSVTLPPFECSVNATAATIAKMPRIALNGKDNTTTDLTLLPTTDLQGGVIYSIFGAAVARFNTIDEYDQACQTLAAGVYVIVTPSTTTKIQIP